MDSIRGCNDPAIQARIANIEGDDSITGKQNNFEAAVTSSHGKQQQESSF
jgi:hypothetical protein